MKREAQTPNFPTALIFAVFAGGLTLFSLIVLLLFSGVVFQSHEPGAADFFALAMTDWPVLALVVALISGVAAIVGYFFGDIVGAPLRRAVSDLANLRALESGRRQASEAVAELQSLSEACRRLSDSLEVRSQRSDETLAEAAHALKAPLARQSLQLELLKRRSGPAPEIENIGRDIETMQQAVRTTLDYARCGVAPQGTLSLIDPAVVFSQAIEKNRPLAAEKGQRLFSLFPAEALYINADPARLSQVLDELLFNAVRFTPSGGVIEAAISENGNTFVLSVSDSGPGTSEDDMERIFEPFYRGEAAQQNSVPGSGMGLALAARNCAGMQAVLKARKRPEGGLCVFIGFPKTKQT